jgi:hypothetical protein
LCRRAYDPYGQGRFDEMLELFAVDVEVYVGPPNLESGTYRRRLPPADRPLGRVVVRDENRAPVAGAAGEWVLAKVRYEVYWDPRQGRAAFAERGLQGPAPA